MRSEVKLCEPEYKAKVLFPETIKRPNRVRRETGSGPGEMAMEGKKTNQPTLQTIEYEREQKTINLVELSRSTN